MQAGGALDEPVMRGDLRITPSPAEELPFDRLQAALRYAAQKLTGQISIRQDDRDVLQTELEAPLDLALGDVPCPSACSKDR